MALGLAVFAVIIALLSMLGVIWPLRLTSFARSLMAKPSGLWIAVLVRVILAFFLWFSAPLSRTPLTFQVLAVIALAAAFALPLVGTQRLLRLIDRVASWRTWGIRLWSSVGVVFAAFLLWSIAGAWTN